MEDRGTSRAETWRGEKWWGWAEKERERKRCRGSLEAQEEKNWGQQKCPKGIFVLRLRPKFQVTYMKSKIDKGPSNQNTFWHTDSMLARNPA